MLETSEIFNWHPLDNNLHAITKNLNIQTCKDTKKWSQSPSQHASRRYQCLTSIIWFLRFWRAVLREMGQIELGVCALKILPPCLHTLTPPYRHIVNYLFEHITWESTQDFPDFCLQNFNIGKLAVPQLGLDGRKGPKVARSEVRTVGQMAEKVDPLLSIVGNGRNRHMWRGVVHVENKVTICVAIEPPLPQDWSLSANAVLQPVHNGDPCVCLDRLSFWHEFQMDHTFCVKE